MPRRFVTGFVYGLSFLLCLIGTSLLFLEQIFNSEPLSTPTIQASRIAGVIVWIMAIGIWLFRHQAQTLIRWILQDIQQSILPRWHEFIDKLRQENRLHLLMLAGAVILAVIMRLPFINQPIRTDEALTYLQFASKPLYLALSDYAAPNNHLLHTFFVHLSTRLFGNSEIAIRLPAFVFGVLVIPTAYLAIRALYNKQAALFAASLCAVSSVLIEYSTNARGYTLQITLFLLALPLATYARKQAQPTVWLLFALLIALGFYTVPTMLYGAGILVFWLLVSILGENAGQQRRNLLVYWFAASTAIMLITLLLYLPVFIVSGVSAVTNNIYVQALAFSQFVQQTPQALETLWQQWHTSIHPAAALFLIIGFFAAFVFHRRLARQPVPLVAAFVVIVPALLLLQRVHPFARNWLFLLPIYFGMAAAGLFYLICEHPENKYHIQFALGRGLLASLMIGAGAAVVLQTQSPYTSIETGTFRDAEAVSLFLAEQLQSGDKIIYEHPSGESLRYYFLRHNIRADALEWDNLQHEIVYVVINTEYAQDIASVLRQNGLILADYEVRLLQDYPLAEVYQAVLKND